MIYYKRKEEILFSNVVLVVSVSLHDTNFGREAELVEDFKIGRVVGVELAPNTRNQGGFKNEFKNSKQYLSFKHTQ